jgi:F-type H+-transporting ATPase subunit gamma
MANLKEIRLRITSVGSTMQITSAMKMVSAAKLKKAQDAIVQLRPYAKKMHEILANLSASLDASDDNPFVRQREVQKVAIILISSNRGLCGAFNSNVGKLAIEVAENQYADLLARGNVHFYSVGKKAADLLKHKHYVLTGSFNKVYENLSYQNISAIAQEFMNKFVAGEYNKVLLVYNQFRTAAVQSLTLEQFLPVAIKADKNNSVQADYIFEPDKQFIVDELIPRSLKTQFYKAVLDSHASEHGARMIAMHKATDNAIEMQKSLRLTYNKARQAAITKEISEVVGGAEALKS